VVAAVAAADAVTAAAAVPSKSYCHRRRIGVRPVCVYDGGVRYGGEAVGIRVGRPTFEIATAAAGRGYFRL